MQEGHEPLGIRIRLTPTRTQTPGPVSTPSYRDTHQRRRRPARWSTSPPAPCAARQRAGPPAPVWVAAQQAWMNGRRNNNHGRNIHPFTSDRYTSTSATTLSSMLAASALTPHSLPPSAPSAAGWRRKRMPPARARRRRRAFHTHTYLSNAPILISHGHNKSLRMPHTF